MDAQWKGKRERKGTSEEVNGGKKAGQRGEKKEAEEKKEAIATQKKEFDMIKQCLGRDVLIRPCPNCGVAITKVEDTCNKIVCLCKCKFCLGCGKVDNDWNCKHLRNNVFVDNSTG